MPIEVEGTVYRLWALDTGVLSHMLKDRKTKMRRFVETSLPSKSVPCISIWSILELRKRLELYAAFLEFFSVCPFVLAKSPMQLFEDELEAYPDPSGISPVLYAFSPFNKERDGTLKPFMDKLFSKKSVADVERAWDTWKAESLDSIMSLKRNFPPQGDRYSADDSVNFVRLGVPQFAAASAPDWTRRRVRSHGDIEASAFPSLKMDFYTVFFRFYISDREPVPQDAFDILISGIAPYVDRFLTEKFQAEIFRQVQQRDPFLQHLEIGTVSDLR